MHPHRPDLHILAYFGRICIILPCLHILTNLATFVRNMHIFYRWGRELAITYFSKYILYNKFYILDKNIPSPGYSYFQEFCGESAYFSAPPLP